jgi:hypothetical protein
MNGKKFTIVFVGFVVVTGVLLCVWMKDGYNTRPKVQVIEDVKK